MKKINAAIFLSVPLTLFCCSNNNQSEPSPIQAHSTEEAKPVESVPNAQSDGLVGEWQLTGIATDENLNKKLDEAERRNAITQAQDYLKLNSDGTCLFYAHKVKGRYQLTTESDGRKLLTLYDKDGNKENRGKVFSVSKAELVLLKAGSTFSIYKRL